MEGQSSGSHFQNLLEAIRASDIVERRAQLISQLGDLDFREKKSDLASLVDCLSTFWEDFTCLDASQCMLNKNILHVAAKCVDSDLSGCLPQFLALATRASAWCRKHLKMTIMSTEDSQEEEHSNLFFQLLLSFLSLSTASMMALTSYPVSTKNASMAIVEGFIFEQLNLTKDIVSEIKRIDSTGSEMLKLAQTVIDAVLKLCKDYSAAMNWDSHNASSMKDDSSICVEATILNHVTNIIKCTIEKLCELGILAANDGGSLVTILNVSWKGVVNLLQLSKGALTEIVSVQDIILTLMSLISDPLRCAAEAWSSSLKETLSVTEARRIFLPVKFYLINAVKISSLYPCQAYRVYREVTLCILKISSFRIIMSYEKLLNTASEVFLELLEKTSMDLLNCLLISTDVSQELKSELLDWLFIDECCSNSTEGDLGSYCRITLLAEIFSISCEAMPRARALLLGRVLLFHTLLRYSICLEEDTKFKLTRKLGWILDILVDEEVYSSILNLQIPVLYVTGKRSDLVWQPMFSALLHALKTFMIVLSSSFAWVELEAFLIENLLHPHFLCWEIIMELWCFLARHAEINIINGIFNKLFSLMKSLVSPELVLIPGSPLRKMARIVCLLLTDGTPSMVDHIYSSIVEDGSQPSSVLWVALLLEGFPLNLLSDNVRSIAKQKIITDYFGFIGSFEDKMLNASSSGVLGIPVLTLSASLRSRQVSLSDVDLKTLKFLIAIIRNLVNPMDKLTKENHHRLLSEVLEIISSIKRMYESDEMEEAILELQNLFVSGSAASETQLYQCKPYLALFMGGLGDMEMSESDDSAKSLAVWELYHMLFRERHWALVHIAIAAFGYFAAHTSCNQLWRFLPQDASLSYDLISGNEANEERFMSELKAFLEKETAVHTITPSLEEHKILTKEGLVLKEMVQKISSMSMDGIECESRMIDVDNQSNKRRKLPDGISRGVELLQSGLKVFADSLSQWQQTHESSELQDKFLAQLSSLEDVITHLMSLTGNS